MKTVSKTRVVQTNTKKSAFNRVNFNVNASTFDLYSTKLYRDPVRSVCREYIANCIDSLIRAGKPEEVVHIGLPTLEDPIIRFRDRGTGIDRFEDVIKHVFDFNDSDKINEEGSTGSLGLGAKSAYALSSQFVFTVYNGTHKRSYVGSKDEQGFPLCPSKEPKAIPCNEPRGVMVEIPVDLTKNSPSTWKDAVLSVARDVAHDRSPYRGHCVVVDTPSPNFFKLDPENVITVSPHWQGIVDNQDGVSLSSALFERKHDFKGPSISTKNCCLIPTKREYLRKPSGRGLLHFANIRYEFKAEQFFAEYEGYEDQVLHIFLSNSQDDGSPHPIVFSPSREYLVEGDTDKYLCELAIEQFKPVSDSIKAEVMKRARNVPSIGFARWYNEVNGLFTNMRMMLYNYVETKELFVAGWKYKHIQPDDTVGPTISNEMYKQAVLAGEKPDPALCSVSVMFRLKGTGDNTSTANRYKRALLYNDTTFYSWMTGVNAPNNAKFASLKGGISGELLAQEYGHFESQDITYFIAKSHKYVQELDRALSHLLEIPEDKILKAYEIKQAAEKKKRHSLSTDAGRLLAKCYKLNTKAESSSWRSNAGLTEYWDKLDKFQAGVIANKEYTKETYCYLPFKGYHVPFCEVESTSLDGTFDTKKVASFAGMVQKLYSDIYSKELKIIGVASNDSKCRDLIGQPFFRVAYEVCERMKERMRFAAYIQELMATDGSYVNPTRWLTFPRHLLFKHSPLRKAVDALYAADMPLEVLSMIEKGDYTLQVVDRDAASLSYFESFCGYAVEEYRRLLRQPLGELKPSFNHWVIKMIRMLIVPDVDVDSLNARAGNVGYRNLLRASVADEQLFSELCEKLRGTYHNVCRHSKTANWYVAGLGNVSPAIFRAITLEDYLLKRGSVIAKRMEAYEAVFSQDNDTDDL